MSGRLIFSVGLHFTNSTEIQNIKTQLDALILNTRYSTPAKHMDFSWPPCPPCCQDHVRSLDDLCVFSGGCHFACCLILVRRSLPPLPAGFSIIDQMLKACSFCLVLFFVTSVAWTLWSNVVSMLG